MTTKQQQDEQYQPLALVDYEYTILGSAINSKTALGLVVDSTDEQDYYKPINRYTFKLIKEMYNNNEVVDLVTVSSRAKKQGDRNDYDEYLERVSENVTVFENLESYIKSVKEEAHKRRINKVLDAVRETLHSTDSIDKILEQVDSDYTAARYSRAENKIIDAQSMVRLMMNDMHARHVKDKNVIGYKSGIEELDKIIGEFSRGLFYIIAGRPSMGKTAVALSIMVNMLKDGVKIGFLSLEMGKIGISYRMCSIVSGVDLFRLSKGYCRREEIKPVGESASYISGQPFYIDDTPNITATKARSVIRQMIINYGVQIVFIDHLHKHKYNRIAENSELAEITNLYASSCKEFNIPIILLAQLSRDKEKKAKPKPKKGEPNYDYLRPTLQDLRGSGAIEQDADVVIFVHRPEYYIKDDPALSGVAELIVAKQRDGDIGIADVQFNKSTANFKTKEITSEW